MRNRRFNMLVLGAMMIGFLLFGVFQLQKLKSTVLEKKQSTFIEQVAEE